MANHPAPGAPGISPRWTTSSKDGVGTSINHSGKTYFTLSHGILNEIYYPGSDTAAIRDMGVMVTNGKDFFAEEKRHTETKTVAISPGIPAYSVVNTCPKEKYEIKKEIVSDPIRNTVLQRVSFTPLDSDDYHLYAILAPRLNNEGMGNTGWLSEYKGHKLICAENKGQFLAFACSSGWAKRSVGFVGTSDGWQLLEKHHLLNHEYDLAENGNIALTGEFSADQPCTIVIGFGESEKDAAHQAISSLKEGFDSIQEKYINEWQAWQDKITPLHSGKKTPGYLFKNSAAVLRCHQSKTFPGGMMASLSIPWGEIKSDDDVSGYHMVWPRDLVESAGGLLTLGAKEDAMLVLNYLMTTQEEDGHWAQNMWLDGRPFWEGIQLDETALPILLIDLCLKYEALDEKHLHKYWETVRNAAKFLLKHGLHTEQERWEEQEGISVYTISTVIAGLLAAADFGDRIGDHKVAEYCRQNADAFNESIEKWLYVEGSRLSEEVGVDGYYIRTNPVRIPASELGDQTMVIKNQPNDKNTMPITEMVSIDPIALVRFGLRAADDPRILSTIKVIDAKLKTETANGPCWFRYVNDGYGEHEDGSGYDGTGIGRPWPLLAGERAHYEVAAGNIKEAKRLLKAMESFSNNGLIPEQIWDKEDILERGLRQGEHSGSAMPLVWAHSEHVKLICSIRDKAVFDMPRCTQKRYIHDKVQAEVMIWRKDLKITQLTIGRKLRIETVSPALIKWTKDDWKTVSEVDTEDMSLGVHFTDLPTKSMKKGEVKFTIFWKDVESWEGEDYVVSF